MSQYTAISFMAVTRHFQNTKYMLNKQTPILSYWLLTSLFAVFNIRLIPFFPDTARLCVLWSHENVYVEFDRLPLTLYSTYTTICRLDEVVNWSGDLINGCWVSITVWGDTGTGGCCCCIISDDLIHTRGRNISTVGKNRYLTMVLHILVYLHAQQ